MTLALPTDGLWKWGLRLGSLSCVAVGWEVFGRFQHSLLLPTFSQTIVALAGLLLQPVLWQALWVSNQTLVVGFAAALLGGIPLGLMLGRWKLADKSLSVYLNVLLVTPMAALVPLFIMISGLGLTSRILVVFVFAIPFIILNTRAGLRQIPPNLIEMAQSFGANEVQLWRKVLLPGVWPALLTGIRIGLGRAITGMVVAELLLSAEGLGKLLLQYQSDFEFASVYAVMLVVIAESVLLLRLVKSVEKRFGSGQALSRLHD